MYECNNCGEIYGEAELHNHSPDDSLWCRVCLENEYSERLNAQISERLCTAGLVTLAPMNRVSILLAALASGALFGGVGALLAALAGRAL